MTRDSTQNELRELRREVGLHKADKYCVKISVVTHSKVIYKNDVPMSADACVDELNRLTASNVELALRVRELEEG